MAAENVLPVLSPEDPLFGLIYYILGGRLIGACLVLLLEGILISQVNHYYAWYPEDTVRRKIAVAVLFILTVLKTIQAFAIAWIHCIVYLRDPAGTVALNRAWYQVLNIPLGAVIAIYVQTYYCYRLWRLSQKWWVIAPILALMGLSVVAAIITASVLGKTGASTNWFAVHVSSAFATDVLITLASTYFLLKAKKMALARTRQLIRDCIKLCFRTALPATTATLIELICSRGGQSLKPRATNSIIIVLLAALPVLYVNCLLYVLNARRAMRCADSSDGFNNSNPIHPPSGGRSQNPGGWNPHSPLELAALGGVQVQTQIKRSDNSFAFEFDTKKGREITA
ncbi:hypothetical protein C8J57DRAFT_1477263 [Mycena rebaudengoi]|nr:hypothetical protein C8J57DRAFT_1477263 [Mycena rebaudengoi]